MANSVTKSSWLFGWGSPVTMGVFRMLIGTLAFVNFAMIAIDFDAWFSERGYVPWKVAKMWMGEEWRLNLLYGVTDTRITLAFYILVMIAALLTALGLFTRVSSVALAIGAVTLSHRNPIILHGGDTILRLSIIYVAIAPSGLACSLDRVIGLWKGRLTKELPMVSLWPQRLVEYQVALVYFTTVYHKWGGSFWRNGTAAFYPGKLTEFDRFWVPEFLDHQPFVAIMTYGTLLVELSLATLVFYKPWRKYVLIAGILMHLGIEWRYNIPLFAFLMIATYVSFYEGDEVSAWAKRIGERLKRFHIRIALPREAHLQTGPSLALEAMDPFELVEIVPGDSDRLSQSDLRKWCQRSVGTWYFAWIPGLWRRIVERAIGTGDRDVAARPAENARA